MSNDDTIIARSDNAEASHPLSSESPPPSGETATSSQPEGSVSIPVFVEQLSTAFNSGKRQIDWSNVRIQKTASDKTPLSSKANQQSKPKFKFDKALSDRFYGLFNTHFHHRWTVIHYSVEHEENGDPQALLMPSIYMIGAHFDERSESRGLAIDMHHSLMNDIFPQLVCY
jgi:hypothetical protein